MTTVVNANLTVVFGKNPSQTFCYWPMGMAAQFTMFISEPFAESIFRSFQKAQVYLRNIIRFVLIGDNAVMCNHLVHKYPAVNGKWTSETVVLNR